MSDTTQTAYEERLAALWQQGNRDIAISFLKRAISADMPLDQLAKALQFPQVREHLDTVRLHDIIAPKPAPAQISLSEHHAATPARASKKQRRRRRSSEEVQALKDAVMGRLQAAVGAVTTPHLCEVLGKGGHDVDMLQMNRMLCTLEAEGSVACTGGRPKGWRLKPQGRTAPEPLVIRKASSGLSTMGH